MVKEWGMSDRLGFMFYGEDDKQQFLLAAKDFSNSTFELIDGEKRKLIDAAYQEARQMLVDNRTALENVAQALLKYETLSGDEVRQIMAGQTLDRPTVADLIAAEQARRKDAPAPPVARPVDRPGDGSEGPMPHPA
jgi:cell division protease FtsH